MIGIPWLIIFSKGSRTFPVHICSCLVIQRDRVSQFLNAFGKHHIYRSRVMFPALSASLFAQPTCSNHLKVLAPSNSGSFLIHGSLLQPTAQACRFRTPKLPVSTSRVPFAADSALLLD